MCVSRWRAGRGVWLHFSRLLLAWMTTFSRDRCVENSGCFVLFCDFFDKLTTMESRLLTGHLCLWPGQAQPIEYRNICPADLQTHNLSKKDGSLVFVALLPCPADNLWHKMASPFMVCYRMFSLRERQLAGLWCWFAPGWSWKAASSSVNLLHEMMCQWINRFMFSSFLWIILHGWAKQHELRNSCHCNKEHCKI